MIQLAIYDMDRTITRDGTFAAWLLLWARQRTPWRFALLPFCLLSGCLYLLGLLSRHRLKELNQALLMGSKVDSAVVATLAEAYAEAIVARECYSEAIAQIASDRVAGRRIVMATASYAFYAEVIARRLGINDVVATRSEIDEFGRILARINGRNCYGTAKLDMVEAYLAASGLDRAKLHIRFYSDHHSDLPMFDFADEPIATNPTSQLRQIAVSRGWQIVDWH